MYTTQLSRFLDRELSPREAADVESHVALCAPCRGVLEHWRRQSTHLRSHLSRHALGEEFVSKVVRATAQQARQTAPEAPRHAHSLLGFRWLPVAAAVLAGIILVSLVIPFKGGIGYARVINPGEKLEVLNSNSSFWVRTTAGEILHPGDWLRNPSAGSAEILWRDSCRLILEPDTLAQISPNPSQPVDQILMVRGAILAETQGRNREFQVRTPAGDVTTSDGRFVIRAGDGLLPTLRNSAPGSEIVHGAVVPFGSVSVLQGQVTVKMAKTTCDVHSGESAEFAGARIVRHLQDSEPAVATLKVQVHPTENPELSASLVETARGMRVEYQTADLSLNKLLAITAGITIRGGEDIMVSGSLSILPGASPQSIASAVGTALEVPIVLRQEKMHGVLTLTGQDQARVSNGSQGEYDLERTADGAVTLNFHAVPAGRAFSVLRTAVSGLPELSAESAWLPIDLEGTALSPSDASAWIVKALGLRRGEDDCLVSVIEVGPSALSPEGTHIEGRDSQPMPDHSGEVIREHVQPDGHATPPMVRRQEIPISHWGESSSELQAQAADFSARPFVNESVYEAQLQGFYPSGGLIGDASSTAKGRSSLRSYEVLGSAVTANAGPSMHLIWPPLEDDDIASGTTSYLVTNSTGLPAHTLWRGYDAQGRLVAEYALVVGKSSSTFLNLQVDLGSALDVVGHWEMLSDIPLSGAYSGGERGDSGIGSPVGSEQLPRQLSLPAWWLTEFGGRFWLVNPGEGEAEAVLTLMQGGTILSAERVIIPNHGAVIWPDPSSTMDFSKMGDAATIEICTVRGVMAAGLAK